MKFIHVADLHLGRRLGEMDLLSDQRVALQGILDRARAFSPHVCLIAGDVYDRAVPSGEAVELLSWFLTELCDVAPVCLIGGNHDAQERLAFGRALFSGRGLHIAGKYDGALHKVSIKDEWGQVDIYLMPFFRAREMRPFFPDRQIDNVDQAVGAVLHREAIDFSRRSVLVLHQFVAGRGAQPQVSESEEPITAVGGLDAVDLSTLDGFCYVALGHLHGPQKMGDRARYAGSPLKYSASESGQIKSLVEGRIDGQGDVTVALHPLPFVHDVRQVKGTLDQLLSPQALSGADPDDYLFATLTDARLPMAPRERLAAAYPNLIKLAYAPPAAPGQIEPGGQATLSPYEQFEAFFEKMNGRVMDRDEAKAAQAAFRQAWEGDI